MLRIRQLRRQDEAAWDAYVQAHPLGSPFHLIAWKSCIQESFSYEAYYLLAEDGATMRGVLPLFLVKSWVIGRALISTPFATYGGPLADAETLPAFREEIERLAMTLRVRFVELRNFSPDQSLGFTPVHRHVVYVGPIGPLEKEILERIPRKTRRIVRKTLEEPFTTKVQTRDYATFERLYSTNLKRLGTPTFSSAYYRSLLRHFAGCADIREVYRDNVPMAAVLTVYYQGRVFPYYGAADPEYNAYAPSTFLYYDLMRRAGRDGCHEFDFGRSKIDSGSGHFKAHWGLVERPLHYEVLPLNGRCIPNNTPNNPRYRLAIQIWRRMPLSFTRVLGPWLVKLIPA